jgi:DNA-binding SARP family transcriptional activator/tetratricopeptide (TPR) repeat protein
MEFRLFGEVELLAADQPVDLGTPRQRAVLAVLLLDAGRPVAIETLVDRVWDDNPPVEARNVLYSHVSRIRQLLRQAAARTGERAVLVERRHAGYVVDVDPDLVDLHRFQRLVDRGRDPRHVDADRADAFAEALSLWRSSPLAGIEGRWAAQVRSHWRQLRLDAVLQWAQVELRLGRTAAVIATVPDFVAEYPLVEPLEDLLMRALHAAGRDAEALDRYTAVRQRLASELGTDPGPELRALHQAILRGELPPPRPERSAGQKRLATPAQLPPDMYGFTGRETELHQLDSLLTTATEGSTAVVISAVSGTAGVGKTARAVPWAHRGAGAFPDGQLYVNLRGFDPSGSPVTPTEAVRGFLDAFEIPPDRVSASFEAQIGLYRSLLAGRRVLVLLDNARDSEQARPLLPGVPGCAVVVTSRNQLNGLVATAGARPLSLDLLTVAEARDLLSIRLGRERMAVDPHAVDDIIESCARLPLALAIVAARAAAHPDFPLAALASELHEARSSLNEFASSDLATDVRAVFSWSYRQLGPDAARMFRQLGLHPGPDTSAPAAASLAGIPVSAARRLLAELARAHLVSEREPGRYTFHDLLRAYATEHAHTYDTETERRAALLRLFDHYVHTAHAAGLQLQPLLAPVTLAPPLDGVTVEQFAGYEPALAWFTIEHTVLLAIVQQAGRTGLHAHLRQLASALTDYLDRRGHWHDWSAVHHTTLDAALRSNDPSGQAAAHRGIARAYLRLGRLDDADTHLRRALDLYTDLADDDGRAHTHRFFGQLDELQGRHAEALRHCEQALDLYRGTGHRIGQAMALNDIGWHSIELGDYQQALTHCLEALELQQELGDRIGQAHTWDSVGYAHHHLGSYDEAVTCYQRAADLYGELGDHYELASTLTRLGDSHQSSGDLVGARHAWQRALNLLDDLGHPDAVRIRTRLDGLDQAPAKARREGHDGRDAGPSRGR